MIDFNKEYIYEKIAYISEQKNKIIQENEDLKIQLNEAKLKIDEIEKKEVTDFIDRLNQLIEGIGIDEKTGELTVIEEKFVGNQEIFMAKHFVKSIIDKAKSSKPEIDINKLVEEIVRRIKKYV